MNGLKISVASVVLLSLTGSGLAQSGSVSNGDARRSLNSWLTGIGRAQLAQREQKVAAIQTRQDAERRQAEVRAKILNLMGGLPERKGPVRVKEFGTVQEEGFRIEKIAYESLPDFWVTANVYVPEGAGPFPAAIVAPGHGPGKESQASWAANLARNGVLTLAIDILGAGERLQHYDPELEVSKVEPSGEHEHASLSTLLIGKHLSRYFVNDGMRGIDYLTERRDVDSAHLGAFGCSGGGTFTAYLGALDPRISVTATACYITSYAELLNSNGAQDAEQTLPNFVAEGLDFADWVELCAPRAYAIVSTANDMFPFVGAKATYEEARRFYSLFSAEDHIQFINGPGGHGNLGPISPQILSFLVTNLRAGRRPAEFRPFVMRDPDSLTVTPTGQISNSLGGETVESINRKEAPPFTRKTSAEQTREEVRKVAGITATSGEAPRVTVTATAQKEGYRAETLTLQSEPGIDLAAMALISDGAGPKPAVLMMQEMALDRLAGTPDVQRLARSGHVVLLLLPRGISADVVPPAQNSILGPNTAIALQAMAVGKSLVGMRADDLIRAVNWLVTQPEVDKTAITIYGRGPEGMAALHAAVLDERIAHVVVENTLLSYRLALNAPLHRNLSDIILPGVLRHYDVSDVLTNIQPRTVVFVNPADAMGATARAEVVNRELPQGTSVVRRGFRDPLPID